MQLSVIILNYNVRYFLELCLKSVQKAISTIDAEIIVVDNNSEDNSCNMVRKFFPNVILIKNKENFGFSKGNNIGVAKAKGEYVCILNPDTVVAEDVFLKLLEFSNSKEKIGIVGCKLINGVGEFLPESKRNIPVIKTAFRKLLGNSKGYYANHLNENETGEIDILVGAFMFMKRLRYIEIKGFDEDYFMYGEDIDLSYKIIKAGYKNYYFGKSSVIHFKGESTLRNWFYAQRFYGAMQVFYKKHFKKNMLFNFFVWLGIKIIYLLRKTPTHSTKKINNYVFISNQMNKTLNSVLPKEVILKSNLNHVNHKTEVIFDANTLSYKTIINKIEHSNKNKKLTYKILPNQSSFILGSDTAISRGEVIILN